MNEDGHDFLVENGLTDLEPSLVRKKFTSLESLKLLLEEELYFSKIELEPGEELLLKQALKRLKEKENSGDSSANNEDHSGVCKKGRSREAIKRRRSSNKAKKKEKKRMKREIEERSRKEALSKAKFEAAHFKQKYELLRTQTLSARMNSSTVPSLRNYRTLSHTMSMNNQLYLKTKMPQCNQLSNSVMNFPAKVIVLGEGVFGKVSVAEFKTLDISVAVKSGKSCYFSAAFEARVLQCLNGHQCFPYVFGIYKNNLVMECLAVMSKDGYYVHTVSKQLESFYKRLRNKAVKTNEETNEETNELTLSEKNWFSICYKVTDAIRYMHSRSILHNDIKGDNVIISTCKQSVFIPKVCDFGKATHLQNPKVYSLTEKEMITYNTRHRHLAHELRNVKGSCQSPLTDTYSLGYMFKTIAYFRQIALLKPIAHGMKDHNSKKRTLLSGVLEELKKLVN